ncbi:MAG: ComF family protein [Rikenellaceae bacterium]|jgi:ComF family protein|nr:ComF family protein [Rikenellaceae bacterium]
MNLLSDIRDLFFVPVCAACGKPLGEGQRFLCTACQWDIPLTGYETQADNPVFRRFWGLLPIENATAMAWFIHESNFRQLVHSFKYRGQWRGAVDMGRWFGRILADTDAYSGVDVIVPVPLHLRKVLKRGYNQSSYIAEGMSREMGIPVEERAVVRRVNNRSQTEHSKTERWENVEGIFAVRKPERLVGHHILLVDDVLTTGATIGSCAEAIFAATRPLEDPATALGTPTRISIATLYASRLGLGLKE